MESSIARKLQMNIQMAALLICFTSVTSSICWYITDTDASWKKKYRTADHSAGPNAPVSDEITGISPEVMRPMEAVISPHCAMIFGTSTSTRPMMISTLRVEAHFLTTLVPYRAMKKINAAMISVHTQYGMPNSVCKVEPPVANAAADAVPIMIR